jgi:uncharacterized protein (DUF1015 family)
MPQVFPFRALQFNRGKGDISTLIAPPYDVLDKAGRQRLLDKNPANIVGIDLPHTPAKELGPPSAYQGAAAALETLIKGGTLAHADHSAMFAYRQRFTSADGKVYHRSGMCAAAEVVPFGPRAGGGVLPHEETFSGPKEDRMALMKATQTQLSPIFGLHADEKGIATALLHRVMASRPADLTATMTGPAADNVLHEVWTITDSPTIAAYKDALAGEDIFIADGHHRYTTQLNYLRELESKGSVPSDHPARRSMMVLVGMSDPGLVIWPTHRVLGGMAHYSLDAFLKASASDLRTEPIAGGLEALDHAVSAMSGMGEMRFGLWDFKEKRGVVATPASADPLQARFPDKPKAWRELVVAYCQYVIVEKLCQGVHNAGQPVKWAFPHTIKEVQEIGSGAETGAGGGAGFAQLAVIVRPTPLQAVKDVSRANQLMPQKSTFFYPKLATGLWMNPLT